MKTHPHKLSVAVFDDPGELCSQIRYIAWGRDLTGTEIQTYLMLNTPPGDEFTKTATPEHGMIGTIWQDKNRTLTAAYLLTPNEDSKLGVGHQFGITTISRLNRLNAEEREATDQALAAGKFAAPEIPGLHDQLLDWRLTVHVPELLTEVSAAAWPGEEWERVWTYYRKDYSLTQSPKIQSIKGDKPNGHVAFGTFVGI